MARPTGIPDTVERIRIARPRAWQTLYDEKPNGKSDIGLRNIPHSVLAGLEADADKEGISVQDMIRRHLKNIYLPKNS